MSLLSLASAGCRQLVSVVDGAAELLSLVLRLNYALASRLVALLSAAASALLLLLDRTGAALRILLTDLAAFVGDVGDAVAAITELTAAAVAEVLLAAGRVLQTLGDGATGLAAAVIGLWRAVTAVLAAVWSAVAGLVLTGVRSVVFMYETVILLLTMVPHGIVYVIVRCFTLLDELVQSGIFRCVSACGAAVSWICRTVKGAVEGARSIPPAAAVGAVLVLLAVYGLRRLARLVSTRGLPVQRLQAATARLLAVCRSAAVTLGLRLWGRARPVAVRLAQTARRSARDVSDGLRAAAALCRLAVAVVLAALDIMCRGLRTFVQNVALGLRLGAGRRAPPLLLEPEPRQEQEQEQEWERDTPPPPAPRRRLRTKTAAGRSANTASGGSVEASRVCVVCLDQDKSVILLPCRHVCVCEPCGRAVGAGDRRCPMCREYIQDALKVFL